MSAIDFTTEGCSDSMSTTLLFLLGCIKFGGHEFVDSPDKSSLSNPKFFDPSLAHFADFGKI